MEPPIPPHYAVEAGSVMPLSQFTRDLRVERAMFETLELNAERGRWHFNEYAISVPETLSHFTPDVSTLLPNEEFLDCLAFAEIVESAYPFDDPGTYVKFHELRTKLILPEDEEDPLYARYPWLLPIQHQQNGLPFLCLTKEWTYTPQVWSAAMNNYVDYDEITSRMVVGFVQDSPTTVRM